MKPDPLALATAVLARNVRAVARVITLLENDDPAAQTVLERLGPIPGAGRVVGITGYPGAGKSSLIDQLIAGYRRDGKRVAVLAVDTTSPLTGGALLGDRIRMQRHSADPQVFVRSMGTRGHRGGLAQATRAAVRVLLTAAYDLVLVETVGVGQEEGEIREIADTVVAVVAPGLGDEVQAMKAGLLEVAHLVVVNKADREGADKTVQELQEWVPCVIRTAALTGEGVEDLRKFLDGRPSHSEHQRVPGTP
jgi:LAO/AO transport system kinase